MRIISGKFRRRQLKGPRGTDLRPTGDRLRETLFNILQPNISDSVFLDVFAGTGAVGLEGLSRGAREVVFIEARHEAVKLIRQNLQICGAASGYRILENDVFTALRTLARENFSAGIAFLDPPYNWGPYRDLIEILFRSGIARSDSLVVVEHHRKTDLPESGDGYRCTRAVRQSDKVLSFFSAGPRPGDTLIHQVF